MSFYEVEIYDENEFKTKYPEVYQNFVNRLTSINEKLEDFEFSQFSQYKVENGTFFLSYNCLDDEDYTATLEGELENLENADFELETD